MLCNLCSVKERLRLLSDKLSIVSAVRTSFQDSLSYVTFLFSEWCIPVDFVLSCYLTEF